jgi:hypothetical protein
MIREVHMETDEKFPSKERVERDGVLVYAEGDAIPASDVDELRRQGYLNEPKADRPKPAAPAKKAPAKKAAARKRSS